LPIFYNVPFKQISGASLRMYGDGTGDVPVALKDSQRIPYIALWPSARPMRFTRTEPALRCIPNARQVAQTLGLALAEAAGGTASRSSVAQTPASQPAHAASAAA
jgi:hypothetical protein